jgi:hypothetical protein
MYFKEAREDFFKETQPDRRQRFKEAREDFFKETQPDRRQRFKEVRRREQMVILNFAII